MDLSSFPGFRRIPTNKNYRHLSLITVGLRSPNEDPNFSVLGNGSLYPPPHDSDEILHVPNLQIVYFHLSVSSFSSHLKHSFQFDRQDDFKAIILHGASTTKGRRRRARFFHIGIEKERVLLTDRIVLSHKLISTLQLI